MSRVKLLLDVACDMKCLCESLRVLADAIQSEDTKQEVDEETSKQLTLEEVRAVLAQKSRNGFTSKIRELLIKYGGEKLSEIDPTKYSELLKDVEKL